RGYKNIRRIRIENPEGLPLRSPNIYDIEFYEMMEEKFWLPQNPIRISYIRQWEEVDQEEAEVDQE
ncbi:9488_t:CDS:2, partial [Gigaspora margarita]